jgi:hypothetical protein
MVASQKHHISVPITDSTKRLNEEKGDSSRSSLGSNSPEIWVPPAIRMVYSEQKDDVNTSDQSEILNAEHNRQLTLNDNSPCPEETKFNSSDQATVSLKVVSGKPRCKCTFHSCFNDFFMALEIYKLLRASNMYCSLHLINIHIKKTQIAILLCITFARRKGITIARNIYLRIF